MVDIEHIAPLETLTYHHDKTRSVGAEVKKYTNDLLKSNHDLSDKIDNLATSWDKFLETLRNLEIEDEGQEMKDKIIEIAARNKQIERQNQKIQETLDFLTDEIDKLKRSRPSGRDYGITPKRYPKIRVVK